MKSSATHGRQPSSWHQHFYSHGDMAQPQALRTLYRGCDHDDRCLLSVPLTVTHTAAGTSLNGVVIELLQVD